MNQQLLFVAGLALLAIFLFRQVGPAFQAGKWLWEKAGGLLGKAKEGGEDDPPPPSREKAFQYTDGLIAYFKHVECKEGLAAAITCGEHLFHEEGH